MTRRAREGAPRAVVPGWQETGVVPDVLWFDDEGRGPSEADLVVYACNSIPGDDRVSLYVPGLGGPYMDSEQAETLGRALLDAVESAREYAKKTKEPER